jgi:hypothetical protein
MQNKITTGTFKTRTIYAEYASFSTRLNQALYCSEYSLKAVEHPKLLCELRQVIDDHCKRNSETKS